METNTSSHKPFHCTFFGGFRLLDSEGHEIRITVTKGAAIIAYLLLGDRSSVLREKLAGLLWSEKPTDSAKTDLRQCLFKLSGLISKHNLSFIKVEKERVRIDRDMVSTDLEHILLGDISSNIAGPNTGAEELLYGFESLDPAYMEWLWDTRNAIEQQIREALIGRMDVLSDPHERLLLARYLNQLDPSLEIAARPIIEWHIGNGNVAEMLEVYSRLWDGLEVGWEEEPSLALQQLVGHARASFGQDIAGGQEAFERLRGLAEQYQQRKQVTGEDQNEAPDAITGQAGFVGRRSYLATIQAAWQEACGGQLQLISVQGPAGIGKSRLIREFLTKLGSQAARKLVATCNRHDRSAPTEPVFHLARQLELDASVIGDDVSKLCKCVAERLAEQPTVIFLDDWQWADDATRLAVQEIVERSEGAALLILFVSREFLLDDGLVRESEQIVLPPMNLREVRRKAEQLLNRPVDAHLEVELFSRSGGNPLYLEEICYAFRDRALARSDPMTSASVSTGLRSLIASRVVNLPVQDVQFLFAAAPNGDLIDIGLLEAVLGHGVPQATLERLVGWDVLQYGVEKGGIWFKHGITREVIYDMIPPDKRQELHKSYLRVLQQRSCSEDQTAIIEQLSLHARESGDVALAIGYAQKAGDKAMAASSLDLGRLHFEIAMDLLEQGHDDDAQKRIWLATALQWAKPGVYAASPDHMPLLERAAKIASELNDPVSVSVVSYWIGYFNMVLGNYQDAEVALRKALALAQHSRKISLIFEITAILGCTVSAQSKIEEADPLLNTARRAKEANPSLKGRAPVSSAYVRAVLAVTKADQGQFDEARLLIDGSLDKLSQFQTEIECSVLCFAAAIENWRGDWLEAREFARRARKRSERVSALFQIGMSRSLYGYADWRLTGRQEALNELKRMAYWLDASGMHLYLGFPFGWLAEALVEAGRLPEARIAADRTLERLKFGETLGAALAFRALAKIEVLENPSRLEAALTHLDKAQDIANARKSPHESANCIWARADILAHCEKPKEALAALDQVLPEYQRLSMQWHATRADGLVATLTQGRMR